MSDYINLPSDSLLQTKLFIPLPRAGLIDRPQLIDRLNGSLGGDSNRGKARLILVCAPAGFGKTTLVSDWLAQAADGRQGWLSLDEGDNDPVRFLVYLIAALQTAVPGIAETALPNLFSPQPPPVESILSLIINDISRSGQPIILVLEDYHAVDTLPVHRALTFLLEHQPPLLQLVIITRSDPPLPLSRLRASGHLLEIRADDLRFTVNEANHFLVQVMRLRLSMDETVALAQRTEGWIAGLQLAALSLQGNDDVPDFIAAFTGSHRFILDYLTDEVLARRPKGTKNFLLQTSILDRFCGALCDAVSGQSDSQAILERLEQANLFLIPLDEERRWYRYHQLFAEALRQHLHRTQPDLLTDLHWRAQEWFKQNGYVAEAVSHALAGGHFERAAILIEQVAGNMVRKGADSFVTRWLEMLPEEIIFARPRLCLAWGWTYVMGQAINFQEAEKWVRIAQEADLQGRLPASEINSEIAAQKAMIAAIWGEVTESINLAREALAVLPPDSPWRSVTAFTLGSTLFLYGDMSAAHHALQEAVNLSQVDGALYIQLNATSFLGDILVFDGHLAQAKQLYEQVLNLADQEIPQKGALMAHAGLAHIMYEHNQLEDALTQIQLGMRHLEKVGGSWAALVLNRVLALVQQVQGQGVDALNSLQRASKFGYQTNVSIVKTQAAALLAHMHLMQGDLAAAEEWAATCGLSPSDPQAGHPGLREEEYLVLARVLIAQGEYAAAQVLLSRLLDAAEMEGRQGSAITILILQSLTFQAENSMANALKSLERGLIFAEKERYIRTFVDEGEALQKLLHLYRLRLLSQIDGSASDASRRHLGYVNKLIAAFSAPSSPPTAAVDPLSDPLSERELEVLRMIAAGATNRDIAVALYLAVPTVKKHVSNILSKLNVASRTQAVAEARSLGFL